MSPRLQGRIGECATLLAMADSDLELEATLKS
jgi:hypothetical protein